MPPAPRAVFEATLLAGHKGAAVEVLFDPTERWESRTQPLWKGRRGVPVRAVIGQRPFETAIVARSKRHWLLVPDAVCAELELEVGRRVAVAVSPDEPAPRAKPRTSARVPPKSR